MARRELRRGKDLSAEEREQVLSLLEEGERPETAASQVGCSVRTVQRLRAQSLIKSRRIGPSGRQLSFSERERISRGLAAGECPAEIARDLGRHRSTIGRELERNGGAERYRALRSHRRALERLRRPKPTKLSRCPRLRDRVEAGLLARWSPQQISARLRLGIPR